MQNIRTIQLANGQVYIQPKPIKHRRIYFEVTAVPWGGAINVLLTIAFNQTQLGLGTNMENIQIANIRNNIYTYKMEGEDIHQGEIFIKNWSVDAYFVSITEILKD